jgi:methanogenic corrinoid protein MtbC1/DNA-binding XRE family transcriptional regulator
MARTKKQKLDAERIRKQFLDTLVFGSLDGADRLVDEILKSGFTAPQIYCDIMTPALYTIGRLWAEGKLSVTEEHRATQIALHQIQRLWSLPYAARSVGRRVMVATVKGEEHFLGAMIVADYFRRAGWAVDFMGPNVPSEDLLRFVTRSFTHVLALSVTIQSHLPELRRLLREVRRLPEALKVIVGGGAVQEKSKVARRLDVDGLARDASDAVRLAEKLTGLERKAASFDVLLERVGHGVCESRAKRGWSQQKLADRAGLDRTYISAVEHGKQNVTLGALFKLAGALELSIDQLMDDPRNQSSIETVSESGARLRRRATLGQKRGGTEK